MAYTKISEFEYKIISKVINRDDIAQIVDRFNKNTKISIVVHHNDTNNFDNISGIKKSTLIVTDNIIKQSNIVIHFINDTTGVEIVVPLKRNKDGNIDWT